MTSADRLDGLYDRSLELADGWLDVMRFGRSQKRIRLADLGATEVVRDDRKKRLSRPDEHRIRVRFGGDMDTAIWVLADDEAKARAFADAVDAACTAAADTGVATAAAWHPPPRPGPFAACPPPSRSTTSCSPSTSSPSSSRSASSSRTRSSTRSSSAPGPPRCPHLHRLHLALATRLVQPAMVVVLLAGLYLALDRWSLGDPWISATFAILIVLFGLTGAVLIPADRRLAELAERDLQAGGGEPSPEYLAESRRADIVGSVALMLVVVAIVFMTAKPGM